MQRTEIPVRDGKDITVAAFATVGVPVDAWQPRPKPRRHLHALFGWLRAWWQREHERRELTAMRGRDFGDLAVPPSLVVDEIRRWPWQKSSPQWSEVGAKHQGGDPGDGPDIRYERRAAIHSEP
ncbi:MAG TPA: hypothetical protein VGF39_10520 [Stellaceae bacterium]|jgi:uncharacterized protein YjiS (DUF1127 family)